MTPLLERAIRAGCEGHLQARCSYPECRCEVTPSATKLAIAAALADDEATVEAMAASMRGYVTVLDRKHAARAALPALRRHILGDQEG